MIVQEIYIDSMRAENDLSIEGLGSGLQVLRASSPETAHQLCNFIPAMLYGPVSHAGQPRTTPVTGSLVAATNATAFDLVRLSDDASQTLHIRDDHGQTVAPADWLLSEAQLQAETYLALFTCRLDPTERLTYWKNSGILQELIGRSPPESDIASIDDTTRDQLQARCRELHQHHDSLKQQCNELKEKLKDQSDRSAYLELRQQQTEQASTIEETQNQWNELENRLTMIDSVLQIAPTWQRLTNLNSKLAATKPLRAHPKHIKRLEARDRKLDELRDHLQERRQQLESCSPTDQDEQRLQRLIEQEPEALQHFEQSTELRIQLESVRDFPSHDELRETVENLTATSQRLTEVREAHFEAAERNTLAATAPRLFPIPSSDETATDTLETAAESDYERVRQRVAELKAESRALLQTRLLSPVAVLAIGGLFSMGVVMFLAALVFNFGTSNLTLGFMGLSASITAILLKFNLDRPPLEAIQQHRAEIDDLLQSIESQELTTDEPVVCDEIVEPAETSAPSNRDLNIAEQEWRELLLELDLPSHCDLATAISITEERLQSEASTTTDTLHDIETRLLQNDNWLRNWHRESLLLLGRELPENETEPLEQEEIERISRCLEDQHSQWQETSTLQREEISELQNKIKQNKRARRKILSKAGADDLEHLKQLVKQRRHRIKCNQERESIEQQIEERLKPVAARDELEAYLTNYGESELQELLESTQDEREQLGKEMAAAKTKLKKTQRKIARLSSDLKDLKTQSQLESARQQLRQAEQQYQEAQIAQSLFEQVGPRKTDQPHSSTTESLRFASDLLSSATEEARHLKYDFEIGDFIHTIKTNHGSVAKPLRELAEHDARLVLIGLQFASVALQPHAASQWPVVVDDDAFGDDANTIDQLALLCQQAASEHSQIVVVTTRDEVTSAFAKLGYPIRTPMEIAEPKTEETLTPSPMAVTPPPLPSTDDWIPVEYQVVEPGELPSMASSSLSANDSKSTSNSNSHQETDVAWQLDPHPPEHADDVMESAVTPPKIPDTPSATMNRANTPPSRWHRLDQAHSTPTPRGQEAARRERAIDRGKDQPPEWWPD